MEPSTLAIPAAVNGMKVLISAYEGYEQTRVRRTDRAVREDVERFGVFTEIHVATSLQECERRDRKGLYKLARAGKIKAFTGIYDPYDVPTDPELRVETQNVDVDHCAHQVLLKLESLGLIAAQ